MDPALYYKIYGERINKQIILRDNKSAKSYKFYYSAANHVWKN